MFRLYIDDWDEFSVNPVNWLIVEKDDFEKGWAIASQKYADESNKGEIMERKLSTGWTLTIDQPYEHREILTPRVSLEDPSGERKFMSFYCGGHPFGGDLEGFVAACERFTASMPNGWTNDLSTFQACDIK